VTVLGIDASTARCGFAVIRGNQLLWAKGLSFASSYSHKARRAAIAEKVRSLCAMWHPDAVIVERLRLFHLGKISFDTIVRLVSVWTTILDASPVKIFTIDTRSWKKRVLGSAKADKRAAVAYVRRRYQVNVSHDIADAICMAEAGVRFWDEPGLFKEME
jgi:Holliday junction resolvasome RuvABC endonuclease subunit